MAQAASCHTCVYAHWDPGLWLRTLGSGFPARPTCANQMDAPGRLKECPPGNGCRNYRLRPPTPTGENVKMIPLTEGLYAYVDATDFEELNRYRWYTFNGYAARNENGKRVYMHRQIMQPPKGMVVDHVNHNRYDNTRANLRNVTRHENTFNMRRHVNATSIYKGVGLDKRQGGWYARIVFMGIQVSRARFREEAEAARAYDRLATELFGAVAQLNFPEEWPPERRAQVYAEASEKREALIAKAQAKKQKSKAAKKTPVRPPQRPKPPKKKDRKRADQ
jgi:hypothetical protein